MNGAGQNTRRVVDIALDERESRAEIIGARREVIRAVHRVDHLRAPTCRRLRRALFAHDPAVGAQGLECSRDEVLGCRVGVGDNVGHRGLLAGLEALVAHAQR